MCPIKIRKYIKHETIAFISLVALMYKIKLIKEISSQAQSPAPETKLPIWDICSFYTAWYLLFLSLLFLSISKSAAWLSAITSQSQTVCIVCIVCALLFISLSFVNLNNFLFCHYSNHLSASVIWSHCLSESMTLYAVP